MIKLPLWTCFTESLSYSHSTFFLCSHLPVVWSPKDTFSSVKFIENSWVNTETCVHSILVNTGICKSSSAKTGKRVSCALKITFATLKQNEKKISNANLWHALNLWKVIAGVQWQQHHSTTTATTISSRLQSDFNRPTWGTFSVTLLVFLAWAEVSDSSSITNGNQKPSIAMSLSIDIEF